MRISNDLIASPYRLEGLVAGYSLIAWDIINLKKKKQVLEKDATDEKMLEWYLWALENGHCVYEYDDNANLLGFAEWIRLPEVPTTIKGIHDKVNYNIAKSAPVLLIMNMITKQPGVLWRLKSQMHKLQKTDYNYVVWHRRRDDKMVILKSHRRI